MTQRSVLHRLTPALIAFVLVLTPLLAVVRAQPVSAAGAVSECTEKALRAALAGGGLVTFSCSGTIPIASQIEITEDTVIDGGGLVTLDGQGVTRLLRVVSGVELTLRGLTMTGANTPDNGGAMVNDGTLTIESSTMTGNSSDDLGGAIYNSGTLTIAASALTGNSAAWAGAIYNNGSVVSITDSTLSGNNAESFGGAIFNFTNGAITITASALSGNSAAFGGAIFSNTDTTVTITASTLSGNNAGFGGAVYNGGAVTITASTLVGNNSNNGGAIFNFGSATLTANILSGNGLCNGPITSDGYNVASDDSCNLTATGDLQNADPLLGALANNGGPTATMLPLTGSPAIDRVPNGLCATLSAVNDGQDQRGAPRPDSSGTACDSGSVELQVNNYFCVGERSGALRYFVTPNGCARGEFRLMPNAGGSYDFCVGERSGSMRYLATSSASCLRGEWQLTLPQVDPVTICVGERSRSVRYLTEPGQCSPRGELAYVIINPVA